MTFHPTWFGSPQATFLIDRMVEEFRSIDAAAAGVPASRPCGKCAAESVFVLNAPEASYECAKGHVTKTPTPRLR